MPEGISWVMNTTASSSAGSTQNVVEAAPPHMNSPGEPTTPVAAGPFDTATVEAARAAAEATAAGTLVSVAGGGDTVAALNHAGAADRFSYVSTAGGAFLEWMEGKSLPGVAALETDAQAG